LLDERWQRALRGLFWACAAFALFMALTPHPPRFANEPGDKVQHMIAFATLGAIAAIGWRNMRGWKIFLALAAFGGFIEIAQAIPALHRDSQWLDWFADMAAAATSLAATRGLFPRR
jgi:hypothetical protein